MTTLTPIGPGYKGTSSIIDSHYPPYSPSYVPFQGVNTFITAVTAAPQLVDVRTVRTKAGHLGQVWYRNEIVWESSPRSTESEARTAADAHLVKALSK